MQTPSKFWIRVRSPSTTLTPTRSVSPGRNSGMVLVLLNCSMASASSCWMRFISFVLVLLTLRARGRWPSRVPVTLDQVRPPSPCLFRRLGLAPGGDLRMIPRSQHFGDPAPFPFDRPGIMRVFEKAAFKALLLTARRGAHYPGKQPNASVEQGQSGRLAPRQH